VHRQQRIGKQEQGALSREHFAVPTFTKKSKGGPAPKRCAVHAAACFPRISFENSACLVSRPSFGT